ncbi:glycosyltransferase family 4 protein [Peribacillus sp. NPDC094092]|uniref:glycosyltransferase family 4 protein n=1 Tax=Peribacillus sp. NPDC094092 TaxID=3390611 RepID=UPI003D07CE26
MEISIIGPTFDASGYAQALRTIVFGLKDLGFMIRIIPKDWSQLNAGLSPSQIKQLQEMSGSQVLPEGPILHITIAQDFHPIPGRINIGMTMLECDSIPKHWVEKCNQMQKIWVPSTFNKGTFIQSGVQKEKISVIPIGVDTNHFNLNAKPLNLFNTEGRFVFVSNFEWVYRKGYDLLLKAFLEEFTFNDPVALVIKTYDGSNFDPNGDKFIKEIKEMINQMKIVNPPMINLITEGLDTESIPSYYGIGNCYIIPTRGEGWNLPALEAMACGLPVITTNWSAHLDFINQQNGYLIPSLGLELIPRFGIPNDDIYNGSRWAVPSLTDTRKLMRYAVENPKEVQQKGLLARKEVEHQWSNSNMIGKVFSELSNLGASK